MYILCIKDKQDSEGRCHVQTFNTYKSLINEIQSIDYLNPYEYRIFEGREKKIKADTRYSLEDVDE